MGQITKMGYLAKYCSIMPHFCCNDIFIEMQMIYKKHKSGQWVVRYERMMVKNRVHAAGN
jgi:hypothetical protein